MSVEQEGEKVEGPLEGQTTNKDEPPQGDQEAAAEDKANNKWEEDFLWSKTALDFKMVEQSWEDDDICEESWEADDPSDCSISNDWQQECGDLLDKKEYNWKKLIFKRKLKDEGFEHSQPHHALIKQLKQWEHDNNTLQRFMLMKKIASSGRDRKTISLKSLMLQGFLENKFLIAT